MELEAPVPVLTCPECDKKMRVAEDAEGAVAGGHLTQEAPKS